MKVSNKIYKTTLTSDMIFTKEDVSTSDEQVERLTREYDIHCRACIVSLIYLLSTRVDLSFAVHKLAKFSANPGKVHFEGLAENFANLCTAKLKSTLVDNKYIKDPMQAL